MSFMFVGSTEEQNSVQDLTQAQTELHFNSNDTCGIKADSLKEVISLDARDEVKELHFTNI